MKKSSFAAPCLAVLALWALLPTLGCGNGAAAKIENAPVNEEVWEKEAPATGNNLVDSRESWRKFLAEAKQAERMKLAEKKFVGGLQTYKVKIVFMKDEIEYIQFGALKLKGVDPDKLYEVGVITLAAKEQYGASDYQIREYVLKFITPRRDGDWKFAYGNYRISKFQGTLNTDPKQLQNFDDKEYQKSYLRELFVKPLPVAKPRAGASGSTGGEKPVETVNMP